MEKSARTPNLTEVTTYLGCPLHAQAHFFDVNISDVIIVLLKFSSLIFSMFSFLFTFFDR